MTSKSQAGAQCRASVSGVSTGFDARLPKSGAPADATTQIEPPLRFRWRHVALFRVPFAERGVTDVFCFVCDGLKGLRNARLGLTNYHVGMATKTAKTNQAEHGA